MASMTLVGLVFNLTYGPWVGLIFSLIILFIFSKWGEKIILVLARARYVSDDDGLINQIKNLCLHLNIEEVKIYWSNRFVNNVYYTNSYLGKPAIIVGKNIYRDFTRNELLSLIYAGLLQVKTKQAQNKTQTALILFALYTPIYLLKKIFPSKFIARSLDIFFYPALAIKSLIYGSEKSVYEFDQSVAKMKGLKKDYMGAIFKLTALPACAEKSMGSFVLSELVHARNSSEDVFTLILFKNININDRLNALNVNK